MKNFVSFQRSNFKLVSHLCLYAYDKLRDASSDLGGVGKNLNSQHEKGEKKT